MAVKVRSYYRRNPGLLGGARRSGGSGLVKIGLLAAAVYGGSRLLKGKGLGLPGLPSAPVDPKSATF